METICQQLLDPYRKCVEEDHFDATEWLTLGQLSKVSGGLMIVTQRTNLPKI